MFLGLLVGGKLLVADVGRVNDLRQRKHGALSADLAVADAADDLGHLLMQSNTSTLGMDVPDVWLEQAVHAPDDAVAEI